MHRLLNRMRRSGVVLLAVLLGLCASAAFAEDSRPLQIIVGYGPGGGTDVMARVIANPLGKALGRRVIVRNVPGAGGQIAASALLREGADGAAVLAINHPDLAMAAARDGAPFKVSDMQILMVDVQDPRVMLVKKDSDIDSFATFVAKAKANPGKLAVSVAQGSAQELFAKWLFGKLGLDVTIVGYKGGAESSNAVLAGDVAATIGDDFARFNLRPSTRALFIGAKKKSPRWPEAPTLSSVLAPYQVTLPSADFMSRYGVYVVPAAFKAKDPAGYAKLQQVFLQSRGSAEFQDYMTKSGFQDLSIGKPGEAFEAAFTADMVQIGDIK